MANYGGHVEDKWELQDCTVGRGSCAEQYCKSADHYLLSAHNEVESFPVEFHCCFPP